MPQLITTSAEGDVQVEEIPPIQLIESDDSDFKNRVRIIKFLFDRLYDGATGPEISQALDLPEENVGDLLEIMREDQKVAWRNCKWFFPQDAPRRRQKKRRKRR